MSAIPAIPASIIASNIVPFVSDRTTFNALALANKEVRHMMTTDPILVPPWPKKVSVNEHMRELDISAESSLSCAALSPSGRIMACGCDYSGYVFIWDAWRGSRSCGEDSHHRARHLGPISVQNRRVDFLKFPPGDDNTLATVGYLDDFVCLWRLASSPDERDTLLCNIFVHGMNFLNISFMPLSFISPFESSADYFGPSDTAKPNQGLVSFLASSSSGLMLYSVREYVDGRHALHEECLRISNEINGITVRVHGITGEFCVAVCDYDSILLLFGGSSSPLQKYQVKTIGEAYYVSFSDDGVLMAAISEDRIVIWLVGEDACFMGKLGITGEEEPYLFSGDNFALVTPPSAIILAPHDAAYMAFSFVKDECLSRTSSAYRLLAIRNDSLDSMTEWQCTVNKDERSLTIVPMRTWNFNNQIQMISDSGNSVAVVTSEIPEVLFWNKFDNYEKYN